MGKEDEDTNKTQDKVFPTADMVELRRLANEYKVNMKYFTQQYIILTHKKLLLDNESKCTRNVIQFQNF